jgi:hypothetical protein
VVATLVELSPTDCVVATTPSDSTDVADKVVVIVLGKPIVIV